MKKDVFNQDVSIKDLAHMIIMHEYPLSIVDHIGFRRFVFGLNSSFKMISRATLKHDIMKMYDEDKKALKVFWSIMRLRCQLLQICVFVV